MAKQYVDELFAIAERATTGYFEDVSLECKHFFSGAALYANQRICMSLTPVGLAMKLPEDVKDRLLKSEEAVPLRYFSKGPIKKAYALFPDSIAKDSKRLYSYARQSIEYVLTLPKPSSNKK